MTKTTTLAERLAPMTIAEIDAMTDAEVQTLMGVEPVDVDEANAWTWREAAKAATDEYADRVVAHSRPVDPARIRAAARRPGRPSIDANAQGGPAAQVRVRVSGDLLARLDEQAAMSHQSRSALVRTALAHYLDASR